MKEKNNFKEKVGEENMAKETANKSVSWFKEKLFNSDQTNTEEREIVKEAEQLHTNNHEVETNETEKQHMLLSKDSQDKLAVDLIISLENLLKDRQLLTYKNKDLDDKLSNSNEMISRLKQDQLTNEHLLQEREKEISILEEKLTNKQMRYDQLYEDYKEYQQASAKEFDRMTNELEKETNKYNKLKEDATHSQYQNMLQIKELEEKIRELEVYNQNYMEENMRILAEKDNLMKKINEFTEQMTFSFSPKVKTTTTSQ